MKKNLLLAGIMTASVSLSAQNADDALRYSFLNPTGTARFSSMGGAFSSLGGDFSSLTVNPGGLGVYRRSEITFTPSFYYQSAEADFNGSLANDSRYNINIANIGLLGSWDNKNSNSEWKSFSLAFGMNRTNNFNSNISIEGQNETSSLLDVYRSQADGRLNSELDPFGSFLAFQTYLIDTIPGSPTGYFSQIPNAGVQQTRLLSREGSMGETFIGFGANYNNKLYLGGSLGITYSRFEQIVEHTEQTHPDSSYVLDNFTLRESLATRGSGFNLKFGFIYRVQEWLRVGGAIHSPTFWNLRDTWSADMVANFRPDSIYQSQYTAESPQGNYDYSLTTPFRAVGGISAVIAKKGIISADYEFVDYSSARLGSNDYGYVSENKDIKNNLTQTGNIRVGGELRLDPFALRAGVAYLGNPYRSGINKGGALNYSFGGGVRGDGYFLDVAYVLSTQKDNDYYMYNPEIVGPARLGLASSSVMVTIGIRY